MGFARTIMSSSLAILATFLLLSTAAAGGSSRKNPASPFCKGAPDRALCTIMVKGAKSWPEAMTNIIAATIEKAKAGKPIAYSVGAKLPGNLQAKAKESIDSTCKEAFNTQIAHLKECIGYVKDDPTLALMFRLPMLSFIDCKIALEDFRVSLREVNVFDDDLRKLRDNLIVVMKKNPAYVSKLNS